MPLDKVLFSQLQCQAWLQMSLADSKAKERGLVAAEEV